jgi:SNF2 family DNA or RNA helicase
MKPIVFVYDIEKSKFNRQFTVRMEERMLSGQRWEKTGKTRVYFASDLVKLKSAFANPGLARDAMQSEMEIQKTEGKSISADMDLTTLRISLDHIQRFLKICASWGVLCNENGDVLNFNLLDTVKPDVHIHSDAMDLFIQNKNFLDCDYTAFSGSVLVFFQSTLFLFNRNYLDVLRKVTYGRRLQPDEFERAKRLLSQHANDLNFVFTTNQDIKPITSFVPVFDLAPNLKFANLYFNYDGTFIDFNAPEKTLADIDRCKTIKRDEKKEKVFVDQLIQRGLRRPTSYGAFFLSSVKRMETLRWLEDEGFQLSVDMRRLNLDHQLYLDIRVKKEAIDVSGTVASEQASIAVQDVVTAINENRSLFRFDDGSFGLTSPLKEELNALRPFCQGNRITVPKHQFALLSEKLVENEHCRIDPQFQELKNFQIADARLKPFDLPAPLEHVLRPYQAYGYMWLCNLKQMDFGGILADDMGLGKTLQVLALLLRLRQNGAKTLLIVPKTLVHNWELEILKFAPKLSYIIHRHHRQPVAVDGVDLIITTYGLVRSDVEVFKRNHWDTMIIDEAQTIKNYYTDTSRKIRKIAADFRLALTGTPLENSLTDLYSIFEFIMPGFFGSLKTFKHTYHPHNLEACKTLRELTKPFTLRRLKRQVCNELPSKTEISIFCELTKKQAEAYQKALHSARVKLTEEEQYSPSINILTALLRLRQIACNLKLLSDKYSTKSGKLDRVMEMADEILQGGNSLLVFSQFTKHLDIVKQALKKQTINYYYLDGTTRNRMAIVQKFQQEKKASIFLISLKTGGVGLNLTNANYVFLLDPWWNPAVENQAIDRCYRIGQSDPVTVYRFISKGSIEEKIMTLKERKRQMVDHVIDVTDMASIPLSEEELKQLIMG